MKADQLVPDAGAGSLFSVPTTQWNAISTRVQTIVLAQAVAAEMTQLIPSYPGLLAACALWRDATFPRLNQAADQASLLATLAGVELSAVRDLVLAADQGALTDAAAAAIGRHLSSILEQTGAVQQQVASLCQPITDFSLANSLADTQAQQQIGKLGVEWTCLDGAITQVQSAIGSAEGGWRAIGDDLADLARSPLTLDDLRLDPAALDAAMTGWTNLGAEATRFCAAAPAQQALMKGAS